VKLKVATSDVWTQSYCLQMFVGFHTY